MSADSWAKCPRCRANGDIGLRENTFREDLELGVNDPAVWIGAQEEDKDPCVILNYTGECQHCGLKVKIRERFPITWEDENRPTGSPVDRPWCQVPAGWFVQHPVQTSVWMEVVSTSWDGHRQQVTLRMPDGKTGTWPREPHQLVRVMPGSAPSEVGRALAAFGMAGFPAVEIIEDQVS